MNKYFNNISTLEELRKNYKKLLKLNHPDNGGNLEIMQEINAEYDRLFKDLKNQHESNQTNTSDTNNGNPCLFVQLLVKRTCFFRKRPESEESSPPGLNHNYVMSHE